MPHCTHAQKLWPAAIMGAHQRCSRWMMPSGITCLSSCLQSMHAEGCYHAMELIGHAQHMQSHRASAVWKLTTRTKRDNAVALVYSRAMTSTVLSSTQASTTSIDSQSESLLSPTVSTVRARRPKADAAHCVLEHWVSAQQNPPYRRAASPYSGEMLLVDCVGSHLLINPAIKPACQVAVDPCKRVAVAAPPASHCRGPVQHAPSCKACQVCAWTNAGDITSQ
jgi:hypothetical protein